MSDFIKSTNDEENGITLIDVLEQQRNLEEQSEAVLGGSDENFCTYTKGYIKRQALYSCLTCCPDAANDEGKAAGICLACSYQCHENHELIELYTKRNFKCDCPTERIPHRKCTFIKYDSTKIDDNSGCSSTTTSGVENDVSNSIKKYPINKDNLYNQNFSGLYCICKRPYPDPDESEPDDMIQCIICEDWYHARHLNVPTTSIPKPNTYGELICGSCMEKYDFLKNYVCYVEQVVQPNDFKESEDVVDVVNNESTENDDKLKSELDKSISDIMSISKITSDDNKEEPDKKKRKISFDEEINDKENDNVCKKPAYNKHLNYKNGSAVFWPSDWRRNLCTCTNCSKLLKDLKVDYLLDNEDTVNFYEENGLKKVDAFKNETDYEREIRALSSVMNRTQQIEAITQYNIMKRKLTEFLRTFVDNNKIVTEADIHGFFEKMKSEKRDLGVSYFCR